MWARRDKNNQHFLGWVRYLNLSVLGCEIMSVQEMAHPSCIREGDTVLLKCSETENYVVSVATR